MKAENIRKTHWQNLGKDYSKVWHSVAKKRLSQKEQSFIRHFLKQTHAQNVLDIGVGNGRILDELVESTDSDASIYGIDIAPEMISICKEKYKKQPKIAGLKVNDISTEQLAFRNTFDFISAIRVLKYSENWPSILEKIYKQLSPKGIVVFDMLNERSINKLYKYDIPIYRTHQKALLDKLSGCGFNVLEIRTFSRIPDIIYERANNKLSASMVDGTESLVKTMFGKRLLGRMFFVAAQKI